MRDEKDRKMKDHKAKVTAVQEADYSVADDKRAKAADELMWLEFETRMRGLIRRVVEPALKLSIEDRESNLDLEMRL